WYTRAVDLLENRLERLPRQAEAWRFLAVAYAARAAVLAQLDRPAEMRSDLVALQRLEFKPDGAFIRLHRACMLTRPAPTSETRDLALTAELPDICRRLGYIYLFDRLEFRQQAPLF